MFLKMPGDSWVTPVPGNFHFGIGQSFKLDLNPTCVFQYKLGTFYTGTDRAVQIAIGVRSEFLPTQETGDLNPVACRLAPVRLAAPGLSYSP